MDKDFEPTELRSKPTAEIWQEIMDRDFKRKLRNMMKQQWMKEKHQSGTL